MTPLSEESKKRLTKFLDGCAHVWVRDGHVSHHTCSECGEELNVRKEFLPKMRSFTTWQDLGDVKEALVKEGEWREFTIYTWKLHHGHPHTKYCYSSNKECIRENYTAWLFTMPRFAELVDEWLKGKEESHE